MASEETVDPTTPEALAKRSFPPNLPLLTSSEVVIYPYMAAPLIIEDEEAIHTAEEALKTGHKVAALFGRIPSEADEDAPRPKSALREDDLHPVGSAIQLVRSQRTPDGRLQLLVHGVSRIGIQRVLTDGAGPTVLVRELEDLVENSTRFEALERNVIGQFRTAVDLAPNVPNEMAEALATLPEPGQRVDFIGTQLNLDFEERQEILGELNVRRRFELLNEFLNREVEILELRQKIQSEAAGTLKDEQREYILRQQLRAIQDELGDGAGSLEVDELREKIAEAGLPEEALAEAERELDRMAIMPQASPEYGVSRTYLDWMVNLPWSETSEDRLDVKAAEKKLDKDHFGLEKPRDRILEYLSVRNLKDDMRGPILCLVGPPGVGKTSLGRSIAESMGREFVRMSLGGVRDESEIRGHRRTYVGALPGRIIQGLRRAGTSNPVFMLDEIDKLGSDFRGDPSSALLEVLDPEQNSTFTDHYLDVPFDLSKVMFIATANSLHTIPPALLDRMEILELSGYTEAEKLEIARRYLVPKQLAEHGLNAKKLYIDKSTLRSVIGGYTREAGLRNLEREIGSIARKAARKFAEGRVRRIRVKDTDLPDYLGQVRYRHETAETSNEVGVVAGLAWTPVGGDILFVEASKMPGKGGLKLTGQVGDVMRESVEAAMTFVRSRWSELGLEQNFADGSDIHIHVPAGAIPKDGPSAGVTMATVLTSVFTSRPVRKDVAMTGEVTLRGKVLPIGGVRDKVLAAHRAGMSTVILPEGNRKDIDDIPESVRKSLKLVFADHVNRVIDTALVKPKRISRAARGTKASVRATVPAVN
ncbi:TPA: endopeptidase La [Candidatus Latescibacteria bacterium]|nr:endopeptidase La [Candidatus Latescibacterota bacterium]